MNNEPVLFDTIKVFMTLGSWLLDWVYHLENYQMEVLKKLQDIGQQGLLHGLIPTKLAAWQKNYYINTYDKRNVKRWSHKLIFILLTAKYNLWKLRCDITHEKMGNALYLEKERELMEKLNEELLRGTENMSGEDAYLMEEAMDRLTGRPVDYIRIWLVEVYLERHKLEKLM